jgi:hypothetical protein
MTAAVRGVAALVACAGVLFMPALARASTEFQKVFLKHYIEEHPDKEFAEFVKKKAKCFVCHQGKKKTNCNPYGQHFTKLLDAKEDKKNDPKILEALITVGKYKSDPQDENSVTYDALVASSQLPGGKLEDVRKAPPADPDKGSAPEEDAAEDESSADDESP